MNEIQVQELERKLTSVRGKLIELRVQSQAAVKEISEIRHWMNEVTVENMKTELAERKSAERPERRN